MVFYDIQPFVVADNYAPETLNNCLLEYNYSYDYGFYYENLKEKSIDKNIQTPITKLKE